MVALEGVSRGKDTRGAPSAFVWTTTLGAAPALPDVSQARALSTCVLPAGPSFDDGTTTWVTKEPRTPPFSPGDASSRRRTSSRRISTFSTSTSSSPATVTSRSCVSVTSAGSLGTTKDTEGGTASGTTNTSVCVSVVSPAASRASAEILSWVDCVTVGSVYPRV
ncbi:hypothetical protein COSO111634_23390 [Corallococcus soli]